MVAPFLVGLMAGAAKSLIQSQANKQNKIEFKESRRRENLNEEYRQEALKIDLAQEERSAELHQLKIKQISEQHTMRVMESARSSLTHTASGFPH